MFNGDKIYVEIVQDNLNELIPQNINLDIIYEDKDIIVINKPYNLVVHPGAGNLNGTVLNALLYRDYKMINIPRVGIVHRLDKNTSGLMVIAKNIISYNILINYFKLHKVKRYYKSIVYGNVDSNIKINYPIARHKIYRTKMSINNRGKESITNCKVISYFKNFSFLFISLETGRTHQIRVHLSHINHPIVGDKLYINNRHKMIYKKNFLNKKINEFHRQALHAFMLELYHPITKKKMKWRISLPYDMISLIKLIKHV
ncbi:RluA family pseudouridine synthase [Buchnera aphidicola (Neophyllaphis podocarpi)]|uniref:RluA family pseudouridine synthase n=1 Tax=Buchnera aphidicola TaxID=9 RepID=UPI0031B8A98C